MDLSAAPTMRELAAESRDLADPPPSRRTRGRHERRDRVYDAAIELFVERGFEDTSMDDIALRAGLARTTVFNHFPRKTAFLEEWTLRRRRRAAQALGDGDDAPEPARLRPAGYLSALAELNRGSRAETAALMPCAVRHTDLLVDHPLARDLAELVEESGATLAPSATPARVGRLLALGYFSAVTRWIDVEPTPFDLADELAAMLDVVLDGATPAYGRRPDDIGPRDASSGTNGTDR